MLNDLNDFGIEASFNAIKQNRYCGYCCGDADTPNRMSYIINDKTRNHHFRIASEPLNSKDYESRHRSNFL